MRWSLTVSRNVQRIIGSYPLYPQIVMGAKTFAIRVLSTDLCTAAQNTTTPNDNYSYRFTARAAARRTTPATLEAARAGSPWPS